MELNQEAGVAISDLHAQQGGAIEDSLAGRAARPFAVVGDPGLDPGHRLGRGVKSALTTR